MMDIGKDLQNAYAEGYKQGGYDALLGTEMSLSKWIPVSERLPEKDEIVLVSYKTTDMVHMCKYVDDGSENPWWSYYDNCWAWNNVILAWMPLPEPYKESDTK